MLLFTITFGGLLLMMGHHSHGLISMCFASLPCTKIRSGAIGR